MPLPALLIPLAIAGGSAVAQAAAKLKSHERLNALRAELEELESRHRDEVLPLYEQQAHLCHRLGLPDPEYPPSQLESEQPPAPPPRWRRLLRQRKRTVADGSPHSRTYIIGRQGAGFAAGAVWKAWSAAILNIVRPLLTWFLNLFPRVAPAAGASGSVLSSVGLRFALGFVSVVGIVVAPLLLAFALLREFLKVRKARRELETIRARRREELTAYAVRTRLLQRNVRMRAYTSCRTRRRVRHASAHASPRRPGSRAAARPGRPAPTAPARR